ncbi:cytochrome c oxidase subunit II [Janthinobacterium sp.]|uniref:cytochrome c oxidase subunit II n=1 Tax=Janthinobacterium sp. TaxID=1871054 RepID=UPI00293D7C2B|nr:cytochrome c oxidase subunit II [Janthinobacterium sp.]
MRRIRGGIALLGLLAGLCGGFGPAQDAVKSADKGADKEKVIKIVAQRFKYTPNEIVLKTGPPVVLEITALDFMHGFKVPDLNLRVDLPPGKPTRLRLTPEKAGVYDFLCDNFCGSGHEEMNGRIIVRD